MLYKVLQPLARRGAEPVAHRVAPVAQEAVGLRLLHRRRRARGRADGAVRHRRAPGAMRVREGARLLSARRNAGGAVKHDAKDDLVEAGDRAHRALRAGQAHRGARARARPCVGPGRRHQAGVEREPVRPVAARRRGGAGVAGDGEPVSRRRLVRVAPEAGGAARRRRAADPRRRRLERDHRSIGADVLRRRRRGGRAAVFVHRVQAGGREEPARRSARRRRRQVARLRRRRAPRRHHAAHQDRVLRQPQQPDGRVSAARAEFERLVDELPPRVLLVADEAYFEYARRGRLSRRAPVSEAPRAHGDAAHLLQDLRPRRAARRLHDRVGRAQRLRATASGCRSTSRRRRRRRRWRRSTTRRT